MIPAPAISPIKQNVTPSEAVKILATGGLQVSEKEAAGIVAFLYTLACLKIKE